MSMKIAAAQTHPFPGDIRKNLREHLDLTIQAANQGASLLLFPEMSLTGYMRKQAQEYALTPDDPRLEPLSALARKKKIVLIAGAPIQLANKLFIGAFIFETNGEISIYTKQFLHEGEDVYFSASSDYNPLIRLKDESISMSICYDIENAIHPEKACQRGTTLYLSSIFYGAGSMDNAHALLSRHAHEHQMSILMSNYFGECWGLKAGGRSAFWDSSGKLTHSLNENDSGLLLVEMVSWAASQT